jgi:ribosomal protein S1
VISLDKEEQRIALSRKKLMPNPWSLVEDKYATGTLIEGKVTRVVTYGAFVEIEPGVEGLLHISQLSRDNVEDPNEIISEGETHLLRIISLDSERQRIGLSLKSVTPEEQIEWMAQHESVEQIETVSETALDEDRAETLEEEE